MKIARALFAVALGTFVSLAIGHVDDPKARDLLPPVNGPVFHAGQGSVAETFPSSGILLKSWIPLNNFPGVPTSGSDCWGYVAPSGHEFAIMGLSNGVAFIDITDPSLATVVGNITGPTSLWRCIKVYGTYCYVGTEAGGGVQVIDLSNIEGANTSAPRVSLVNTITVGGNSQNTHTLAIDTRSGYLYRAGGGSSGIRIYDVRTNPANPTFVGQWNNVYVHECQVVTFTTGPNAGKQIAMCCGGSNSGNTNSGVYMVDVTNKAAPVQLSYTTYPGARYCHQAWLSNDQQRIYINDELDEGATTSVTTTIVMNVSNMAAPVVEGTFNNGNSSIGHNLYIGANNKLYEANYKSGVRIFDLAQSAANPPEVAYFDTWPADDGAQFNGLWNIWPFFPSGTFIGSDINRGLFVWRLGGPAAVFSYPNGLPSLVPPSGGTLTVQAVPAANPLPSGSVKLVTTINGVDTVAVMQSIGSNLYRGTFPNIPCTTSFTYNVRVDTADGPYPDPAGPRSAISALSSSTPVSDTCEAIGGWSLSAVGDTATAGFWVNANPVATTAQPEDDHTPGLGVNCFVTGNGVVGGAVGAADVDGGITTLTTPSFDGSGVGTFVRYWRWFSNDQGSNPLEDSMPVSISGDGGITWTLLEDVNSNANAWVQRSFLISDYLPGTSNMRLRFVARDIGVGGSIVEAAIDDFEVIRFQCAALLGDLNGDNLVNGADLGILLAQWGQPGSTDLNGDGTTNGADLGTLLSRWSS